MHICFLTNEYPKINVPHGGVGTFVQVLSLKLVATGHQVTIIGTNNTHEEKFEDDEGVKVYRTKSYKTKRIAAFLNAWEINKKIKKVHDENPINVVEATELGLALIIKIKEIKYLIRMNGGHHFFTLFENRQKERIKVWLEKKSFAKADYLVAVSQYVSKITLRELKQEDRKVVVIFNPVNTEKFNQVDYSKAKPNSLLFVGSVCEKKGIRQLILALKEVKKVFPDVTLKIIGRDWYFANGQSYIDYLKTFISEEIKNAIEIVGSVDNSVIPAYIEQSEICVYPSHMEAMPLAWLEVLSMGKQFLASAIGPGFEVVKNKETGLLCDPHNPTDIAEKIIWMLENKEEAIKRGKAAREDILKRFDISILIEKNIAFYANIADRI